MAEVAPEIETKFDVAPDFAMPPLDALASTHGHVDVDVDVVHLVSTYYDTEARDLLRQRLALRRRLGDADTGWQLKVPASEGRTELRWPPEGDEPPIEMLDLLGPFLRGHPLHPAVTLDVTRTRHRLVAEVGGMLAEIAADDVRAIDEGGGVRAPRWHEVEVELGSGSRDLLQEVGKLLRRAGACPSTSRSKLARATVGIGNEGVGTPRTSAGALLLDYLNTQADAIVAGHFAIHRDADDSVHKTRVACRRIRSTLRTFGDFFDAEQASAFDAELRWYAEVLGNVRDAEVLRARFKTAVADLPADVAVGDVGQRIDKHLEAEHAERMNQLRVAMRSERYAALLAEIGRWRADPPFTAAAGRPAEALQKVVVRMAKRLRKRVTRATEAGGAPEDMHRARKTGKRTRYAAEVAPVRDIPDLVHDATALQDILGEYQDSVVATALLQRLAEDAPAEAAFGYGVLVARERRLAEEARQQARAKN
jgi:CHAD domain-containing protein